MNTSEKINFISGWIADYSKKNNFSSLVIGISGGIDSAVTSTLSARTNLQTHVVTMPILDHQTLNNRGNNHVDWLKKNFKNITHHHIDLSKVFGEFQDKLGSNNSEHGYANSQARLRMTTLYQIAASNNGIVVGTGNKVEDFGIGFYTKYGDGGVDISPIADLLKSEVFSLARFHKIIDEIIEAEPNDGLWNDNRSDEDQIGATYSELEWAMIQKDNKKTPDDFKGRDKEVLEILMKFNSQNSHKMDPIPIFKIPENLK